MQKNRSRERQGRGVVLKRFIAAYLAARVLKFLRIVCAKDRKPKRKFKHKSRAYAFKFSGAKSALWARSSKRKAQITARLVKILKFNEAADRFCSVFAVMVAVKDAAKPRVCRKAND